MTQVRNLFIIQNDYCKFHSLKLTRKGWRKMAKVSNFIASSITPFKGFTIIYDDNKRWITESTMIVTGTLLFPHKLESFTRFNGNAAKMVTLIDSTSTSENESVILITNNKGVMDLIDEFKKTRPMAECFYKKLDRAKLTKLKKGRLSFVGTPNKKIKKEMSRIPFSLKAKPAAKISRMTA